MARDARLMLQGLGTYNPVLGLPEEQYVPIPWLKPINAEPGIINPRTRRVRKRQFASDDMPVEQRMLLLDALRG